MNSRRLGLVLFAGAALLSAAGYAAARRWRGGAGAPAATRACPIEDGGVAGLTRKNCPLKGGKAAKLPPGHPAVGAGALPPGHPPVGAETVSAPPLDEAGLTGLRAADCPFLSSAPKPKPGAVAAAKTRAPVEEWLKNPRVHQGGQGSSARDLAEDLDRAFRLRERLDQLLVVL